MGRLKPALALCVVGATVAIAAPATAGADTCVAAGNPAGFCINTTTAIDDPCAKSPSLPTCVNDAFDKTIWALQTGQSAYNNDVQPVLDGGACAAYTLATGKPCPGLVPTI